MAERLSASERLADLGYLLIGVPMTVVAVVAALLWLVCYAAILSLDRLAQALERLYG